jgi:hypothetical protein
LLCFVSNLDSFDADLDLAFLFDSDSDRSRNFEDGLLLYEERKIQLLNWFTILSLSLSLLA